MADSIPPFHDLFSPSHAPMYTSHEAASSPLIAVKRESYDVFSTVSPAMLYSPFMGAGQCDSFPLAPAAAATTAAAAAQYGLLKTPQVSVQSALHDYHTALANQMFPPPLCTGSSQPVGEPIMSTEQLGAYHHYTADPVAFDRALDSPLGLEAPLTPDYGLFNATVEDEFDLGDSQPFPSFSQTVRYQDSLEAQEEEQKPDVRMLEAADAAPAMAAEGTPELTASGRPARSAVKRKAAVVEFEDEDFEDDAPPSAKSPLLSSFGPSSAQKAAGKGGYNTDRPILAVDAPIQKRNYVLPSRTSRKKVPVAVAAKWRGDTPITPGGEDDGNDADVPPALKQKIERKRVNNTLAARVSRQRKAEYLKGLEDENAQLKAQNKALMEENTRLRAGAA